MGNNNNNMGTTWAQKYNKGVVLIKIRGYTSSIGANKQGLILGLAQISLPSFFGVIVATARFDIGLGLDWPTIVV